MRSLLVLVVWVGTLTAAQGGLIVVNNVMEVEGSFNLVAPPNSSLDFGYDVTEGTYLKQETGVSPVISLSTFTGFRVFNASQTRTVNVGDVIDGSLLYHHDPFSNGPATQISHITFDVDTSLLPVGNELIMVGDGFDLVASDFLGSMSTGYEDGFGRMFNNGSITVTWSNFDTVFSFNVRSEANASLDQSHFRIMSVGPVTAVPEPSSIAFVGLSGLAFAFNTLKRKKRVS